MVKFLTGSDYGRALARADFLQPARASLVDDWVGFIREEFPETAKDIDIEAFTDGHVNNYSVTAEIFANQQDAQQITYDAWEQIFTFGKASVDLMETVCAQIEKAQESRQ